MESCTIFISKTAEDISTEFLIPSSQGSYTNLTLAPGHTIQQILYYIQTNTHNCFKRKAYMYRKGDICIIFMAGTYASLIYATFKNIFLYRTKYKNKLFTFQQHT